MTPRDRRAEWLATGLVFVAGCTTAGGLSPPPPPATAVPSVSASSPPPTSGLPAPEPTTSAPPETGPTPEIVARFFTSPAEQRDELARNIVLPWLSLGLQAEAQSSREHQAPDVVRDTFFDSITGGARIVPFDGLMGLLEVNYDAHDTRETTVDEATIHLGGTKRIPWYLDVGKTDVPFGEYNSHFREDPLIQKVGEMQGWQTSGGYDTDELEATVGVYKGVTGNRNGDFLAKLSVSPFKDFDVGAAWCSDISESVELRQIAHDYRAENGYPNVHTTSVMGADAFATYETEKYFVDFEYVTALKSFNPGILSDSKELPWSCDLDLAIRPIERWEFATRFEFAGGIPDEPKHQYGMGVSYGLSDHASISLEWLHGVFESGTPNRDIVEAGLIVRW
jgi:hypothetical protein